MTATTRHGGDDRHDLLRLDDEFDDEVRFVRDSVRALVADHVLPEIATWFADGTFQRDLIKRFANLGLLGMHLEGYGCAGTSGTAYGMACRELEAGDSGLRSFVSVQGSLAMFPIWSFGSEEQKLQWLPPMASGEVVGCFGLTEPDAGSDPASMRTAARRDGRDWVLDGTKMWITNGAIADVAIVWARTVDGVRGFIVPTDTPGFSARDVGHKMSLRASVTSELVLDGVRLPAESALPGARGLKGALRCLNEARYGILWGVTGAARACFGNALEYSRTREQFGRPIGGFQLTQQKLVEMGEKVWRSQLLASRLGRLKDAGELTSTQVSFGKLSNVRDALEVARTARSVLGANGITLEYPVIRHMNNLESVYTYEGTHELHTLVVGETLTGLAAYAG